MTRTRLCTPPLHDGKKCVGSAVDTSDCSMQPCPVDDDLDGYVIDCKVTINYYVSFKQISIISYKGKAEHTPCLQLCKASFCGTKVKYNRLVNSKSENLKLVEDASSL